MKNSVSGPASAGHQGFASIASGSPAQVSQNEDVSSTSSGAELGRADAGPLTFLHEVLVSELGGILSGEKIGTRDDFFELGVDSILGVQLISKLNQMFQMRLPSVCLFEAPTVEQLAQYMIAHEAQPGLTERTAILLKQVENMSEKGVR